MVAERPVVELGELTNAALDAWTDCRGPEYPLPAEFQVALAPHCQEPLDFFLGRACKEKDFVKISLAGQFGLFLWEARVLGELAGRERAQSYNQHPSILREGLQGLSGRRQRFRDGNTREAPEAQGGELLGP